MQLSQRGGEIGVGAETKSTLLFFRFVIPAVTFLFGINFPGCLQLSLFTTTAFQIIQSSLFTSPLFRTFTGMHPLPEKKTELPKVLNVKGRVINERKGPTKPQGVVPRLRWHMQQMARETQETSENLFPKEGENKKKKESKGPRRL